MERRFNQIARERFESVRNDLVCRLGTICRHLQESELIELTSKMARLQLRYDHLTAVPYKDDCASLRTPRPQS
jgi:hypothetical protein